MIKRIGFGSMASTLLVGYCVVAPGCEPANETRSEATATPEKVVEQPSRYIGEEVSLSGVVGELYEQRAFELEGTRPFFDDDLLVLAKSPVTFAGVPLQRDDAVVVTGQVREFNGSELRNDLGWNVSTDIEEDWRAKPMIVATSIARKQEAWSEGAVPIVAAALISVYLSADPQTLAGQGMQVEDAKVQSTEGKGLWIGNSSRSQMYVVPQASAELPRLSAGDRVDVTGILRKVPEPEEAVRQFGFAREAAEQISGEPLYLEASSVAPSRPAEATEASSEIGSPPPSLTAPVPPTGTRQVPQAPGTP
jgi:hypothetical protein